MMEWALEQAKARKIPRLAQREIGDGSITIAGYGPSLEDTWQKITQPVITMSGSLKFLLEKGLKPQLGNWFHVDMDPRPHKLEFIENPHPDVIYLMASVCHPRTWKTLNGAKVVMWHAMSGPHTPIWGAEHAPGEPLVTGGSTIGLAAVHIGGCLGFRHFEIHGFDGSFRDHKRHAGDHGGFPQAEIERVEPWGIFMTSKIMDNANYEVIYMLDNFPIFCVFHGEGLIQSWVKHMDFPNAALDGTEKADSVRKGRYIPLTEAQSVDDRNIMLHDASVTRG